MNYLPLTQPQRLVLISLLPLQRCQQLAQHGGANDHQVCLLPPQGRCEWESDSGRMLTLRDTPVNELSRVELEAMQRLAIGHLQSMDIAVSHAVLKGMLVFRNVVWKSVCTLW